MRIKQNEEKGERAVFNKNCVPTLNSYQKIPDLVLQQEKLEEKRKLKMQLSKVVFWFTYFVVLSVVVGVDVKRRFVPTETKENTQTNFRNPITSILTKFFLFGRPEKFGRPA